MIVDVYDMTLEMGDAKGHRFSLDQKKVVESLRKLADAMEGGQMYLQSARVAAVAAHDDFPMTTMRLVFYDRTRRSVQQAENNVEGGR